MNDTTTTVRPLHAIAWDIIDVVAGNPRTYAMPYLSALTACATVEDRYGMDTADSLIRYALSNLTSWRGEDARRLKAELKSALNGGK